MVFNDCGIGTAEPDVKYVMFLKHDILMIWIQIQNNAKTSCLKKPARAISFAKRLYLFQTDLLNSGHESKIQKERF